MIEAMAEAVGMPERVPFSNNLVVGRPRIQSRTQSYQLPDGSRSPEWRVFMETGQAIGTVHLPEGLRVLGISAEALVGVQTDELGRQFVQVHALDRRGNLWSRLANAELRRSLRCARGGG